MAARAEREQCIAQLINVITEQEISFAELTQAGLKSQRLPICSPTAKF
jgi:hypothetical protein